MIDPVWSRLRTELSAWPAEDHVGGAEALNGDALESYEAAIARVVAYYLTWGSDSEEWTRRFRELLKHDESAALESAQDLQATLERDQACRSLLEALLFRKGFQAMTAYRLASAALAHGDERFALAIQHRSSCVFSVDIHPRATIAGGVVLDHGTGLVIGETALIETGCYLFHAVTLGSTGAGQGKRHPTIRQNVFLGAGSTVLGDIEIGEGAVVAAGSVVVRSVAERRMAGGVPAKDLGEAPELLPARVDH